MSDTTLCWDCGHEASGHRSKPNGPSQGCWKCDCALTPLQASEGEPNGRKVRRQQLLEEGEPDDLTKRRRERVLAALEHAGRRGGTDPELAHHFKTDLATIRDTRLDLLLLGLIKWNGTRRDGQVWIIVAEPVPVAPAVTRQGYAVDGPIKSGGFKDSGEGPDTSRMGAESSAKNHSKQHLEVIALLKEVYPDGLTDEEGEQRSSMTRRVYGARRHDLMEPGIVEYSGSTRLSSFGKPNKVWRLTAQAAGE